ncbi:hypothetical protein HPB47_020426 [Ixodes persulcatus]|uniref:Uncharacterized protein n=1 Tax=Ixodes persulcatus TaxID=34615 RepID=A0AC60QIY6_IXOPE|nr:hypothetical protein HPB47_020426 [Ixodes persulcatus]
MPHVTKAVVKPNGFEKMRVNYAFRFFSDEVRRGLFLYKEDIECQHGSVDPTSAFVKLMQELISIMTSRFSAAALRPNRLKAEKLSAFLLYLDDWERIAGKNGFLSASTAEGLRVTISSTLSLLEYLTSKVGFRFLMTSRMSQDSLEQLFGVVRQMSGSNDHPTPVQFLLSLNTLSFMNLAKSPDSANVSSGLLSSLLCIDDSGRPGPSRVVPSRGVTNRWRAFGLLLGTPTPYRHRNPLQRGRHYIQIQKSGVVAETHRMPRGHWFVVGSFSLLLEIPQRVLPKAHLECREESGSFYPRAPAFFGSA